MKTLVRTDAPKFRIKKRILFISSIIFTVTILFMASGCIEEDYPVRLVFPVLTTASATNITATSAVSGGNVTSEGGNAVTARGVCWSRSANPSVAFPDSTTVDGNGPGQFTSNIDGLVPDKTYHIRAYATNPEGTAYGQDISFTTAAE